MCKYEKILDEFSRELDRTIGDLRSRIRGLTHENTEKNLAALNSLEAMRDRLIEISKYYEKFIGELINTKAIYHRWSIGKSLLYYHIDVGHLKPIKGKGRHRLFDAEEVEQVAELYKWKRRIE